MADGVCVLGILDRFSELNGNRVTRKFGETAKNLSSAEAEETPPESMQVSGNHRATGSLHDFHHAPLELLQLAGSGNPSLRKNADQFAVQHRLFGGLERLDQGPGTFGRFDGNHSHEIRERLEDRHTGKVGINDVSRDAGARPHHHDAIHERHMIHNNQRAALFRDVLSAMDFQPIKRMRD